MFYLVLERDLKKISLARKHVLSGEELFQASIAIYCINFVAMDRIEDLRSEFEKPGFPVTKLIRSLGIFKHQNLEAKHQFEIFANGLVCTLALTIPEDTDFTCYASTMQPMCPEHSTINLEDR
jgi:hypothetical protein